MLGIHSLRLTSTVASRPAAMGSTSAAGTSPAKVAGNDDSRRDPLRVAKWAPGLPKRRGTVIGPITSTRARMRGHAPSPPGRLARAGACVAPAASPRPRGCDKMAQTKLIYCLESLRAWPDKDRRRERSGSGCCLPRPTRPQFHRKEVTKTLPGSAQHFSGANKLNSKKSRVLGPGNISP